MTRNRHRGEVLIQLGDNQYRMVFDWDAIARLKEAFGNEFDERIAGAGLDLDMDVTAEAIAIGLQKHHPEIGANEIKTLSPPLVHVNDALRRGLNMAFYGEEEPEPKDDEADPQKRHQKGQSWWRQLLASLFKADSRTISSGA